MTMQAKLHWKGLALPSWKFLFLIGLHNHFKLQCHYAELVAEVVPQTSLYGGWKFLCKLSKNLEQTNQLKTNKMPRLPSLKRMLVGLTLHTDSNSPNSQESGNRNTISQPKWWDKCGSLWLCHIYLAVISSCDPASKGSTRDAPLKTLHSKGYSLLRKKGPNVL